MVVGGDMLGSYRVVDLTDERGNLAAFLLAGLGAEVVLVEPPDGGAGRRRGPFAGPGGPERSLPFWGWNRGKRSVVIDLTSDRGQAMLARLCGTADVVIESGAVPVNLARLRAVYERLITVTISAFGTTGPKADWPTTDLTVHASACHLAMSGDQDRPPVRPSVPQTFLHAAADAAQGALLALTERSTSGRGQHVEVTAQRSMTACTQGFILAAALGASPVERMSGGLRMGGLQLQGVWPCQDGLVHVMFLFGASIGPFTRRLMEWIYEEGYCDAATRDKDWLDYGNMLNDGREPAGEYQRVTEVVGRFCADKTKAELLDAALDRILLIAPISTPRDLLDSPHFRERQFFEAVEDQVLSPEKIPAPGPWFRSSLIKPLRLGRAPRLGEHTEQVLGDLPDRVGPTPSTPTASRRPPLEGVKLLDLSWAIAGPTIGRVMADFGATVVRVETVDHPDVARVSGPFIDDVPGLDSSGLLFNMSAGKRSVSLNLRHPDARPAFEDLVRWSDVVVESFSPRARASLGLDYQRLAEVRPNLVMLSTCLFGQTGPLRRCAGFGSTGAAIIGFGHLGGWPGRPPRGPWGAYTDYVSPRFALCTLLAALDHRRRTGEGQYLDFAQAEATAHFLTPALLDEAVNHKGPVNQGNTDPHMAPHGVYPCAGDDQWVAIACRHDEDWRAFASVLGRPDLAPLGLSSRQARLTELEELISSWTKERSTEGAETAVIAAGVPAHRVQNSRECLADPQLRHLNHFLTLPHPQHGTITLENCRITMSDTPARVERTPPSVGQDTFEVLTEILGYDPEHVGQLLAGGVLD
jgi:crotonobetainyl-CoA:carnitine CoA-transferase CaiB-like acyl-CoA transferase